MAKQKTAPTSSSLHALLARAAETYKRALIGHQRGLSWDYVVLTAANEHQAAGYRHELALRSSGAGPLGAFFPSSQQSIVVPDPPGFRAGSGGATFGVLRGIAQHQKAIGDRKPFEALRILLIHSGGASQRLPQYSPLGKIFTPLPLVRPDGQLMTLFDHLYLMMAGLPPRLGPGMLVAAGDVFLLFDAAGMTVPPAGVTALSMRTAAEMGEQHGVFKTEALRHKGTKALREGTRSRSSLSASVPQCLSAFPRVVGTMQKATVEQMRSAGVTDKSDRVLIDSGMVFFDAAATTALYGLSGKYTPAWHVRTRQQIDLYADIVPAALGEQAQPVLTADAALRKLQTDLRGALAASPLHVYELAQAHFQHLGTTRQFRDAMTGLDKSPACALFQQNVRVATESRLPKSARVYQSVITTGKAALSPHGVVENCLIERAIAVGAGSILSNLCIRGVEEKVLNVPAEMLVYGVPIIDGGATAVATVLIGVQDDPKTDRTICNMDLRHWLTLSGLSPDDIWEKGEAKRVLWTARLFTAQTVAAGRFETPLEPVLWFTNPAGVSDSVRRAWKASRRFSMAQILESADASAMAAHHDALSGMLQAAQWIAAVEGQTASSVQNTVNHFGPSGYQRLTDQLFQAGQKPGASALLRARVEWSLAEIQSRPHFPRDAVHVAATASTLQNQAFEHIRQAMETRPSKGGSLPHSAFAIPHSTPLTASAPVRLDFAGGWTDTPPYCLENGGAVVNVAINLNDVEPIQSVFQVLEEPMVRLVSRDLGKTLIVRDPAELLRKFEAGDPFALHVAALRLTGIVPQGREQSQKAWLGRLMRMVKKGRGFELSTASNLPKGSGMGTSSILGATALAVLRKAVGMETPAATLFEQTLLLEQHLGTGGGWQDQVGGIVGGAKITTTTPGIPQVLKVRKIPQTPAQVKALEERLVVYFTGQQRLARNILREVMGRYLSREPGTMVLFNELTHSAFACEAALKKSDWLSLGMEINRYWRTKKDLFPGSTTPAVDALFLELRPFYLGGCLAGAGGGGFAYFLCADADQAHRLRTELARLSMRPGSLGLTFATDINSTGLRVYGI